MNTKQKLTQLSLFAALCMGAAACDKGNDTPADEGKTTAPAADAGAKAEGEAAEAGAAADGGAEVAVADPAVQAEADAELNEDLSGLDPKVQKAVTIAREIEADPSTAETVLAKHELDREGLDALMYEIARNPELSRAYRDARMAS